MKLNTYQKVAILTVCATLFLIFVGGLVRAAGAGLGCPDWPKCFGMWIPPTSAAELPPAFNPESFNVFKTWTEYLNRLVGVIIGFLILATFVLSFRYRKEKPSVFYSSLAAFVLVLVQGWLGGQVVITGLDEWLITLHMFLAMVIMSVLLYACFEATQNLLAVEISEQNRKWLFWTGSVLLVCTFGQLILGTQVRESVDLLKNAMDMPPRENWLDLIGSIDEYHRTLSWAVFLPGIGVFYLGYWRADSGFVSKLCLAVFGVILFQIGLGAGLYYLGMPPAYQVFHLFGVAVLVCLEFLLLLVVRKER